MQKPHLPELIFFFILLAGAALGAYFVLSPYLVPLFLGAVLAILMRPIYRELHAKLVGKPGLAAGIATTLAVLIVLLPLGIAGLLLANELASHSDILDGRGLSLGGTLTLVQDYIHRIAPSVNINTDPSVYTSKITSFIELNMGSVVSGTATVGLDLTLMLVALYFFLLDGHRLHAFALAWSPLPDRYDRMIISRVSGAITAVVKGTLLTAIVQGILAGIGFWIFGISSPILWGALCILAALIPLAGTALVTVPLVLYLFAAGNMTGGIGLLLFAAVIVGGIENILRPMLIRGGLNVHSFLILLSVLGGLPIYGPVGFIAGPVTLALFFALLELYPEVVKGRIATPESLKEDAKQPAD